MSKRKDLATFFEQALRVLINGGIKTTARHRFGRRLGPWRGLLQRSDRYGRQDDGPGYDGDLPLDGTCDLHASERLQEFDKIRLLLR